MRYMLMMHAPSGNGDWQVNNWSPEDFKAHIAFMHSFNKELTNAGELVGAEGLASPAEAKVVRATKGTGAPVVTDGPFAESKEFLAGYWIVEVDRPERAYALAARVSAAPGRGGAPLNMPLEVRQVMSGPPSDA
ncbi:MAG TPA: YciI family protein [Gemmatimonadaceae bacterium]|nr:YciI family protein [Gemmatimonadaceae bacterium]